MHSLRDTFIALSMLWRGGEYGYFWQKGERGGLTTWIKIGDAYRLPQDGEDWYWGVHPTTAIPPTNTAGEQRSPIHVRAQTPYIAAINCFFAEFDAKDFAGNKGLCREFIDNKLPMPPSLLIDSGGGFHYYIFLDEPVMLTNDNRKAMDTWQKKFVAMMGSDDGAKDMCRVLRIPGTFNAKYDPPRLVEIVGGDGKQWKLADICSEIEMYTPMSQPVPPPVMAQTTGNAGALVKTAERAPVGSRNKILYWAACRMMDNGANVVEAQSQLMPAALRAGLTESETRATIRSAQGRK